MYEYYINRSIEFLIFLTESIIIYFVIKFLQKKYNHSKNESLQERFFKTWLSDRDKANKESKS